MYVTRERVVGYATLWALSLLPVTFVFQVDRKDWLYALLLLTAIYLFCTSPGARRIYRAFTPTALAFGLYLPYSLAGVWLQGGDLGAADNGLHFLFFLVAAVSFLELRAGSRSDTFSRIFWCGISVGAVCAAALAIYQRFSLHIIRPYGMYGINELAMSGSIKFGMVTALFSLLALVAALNRRTPARLRLLHGAAALIGVAGCQTIASRGPLITLVVIGAAIIVARILQLERKWRLLAAATAVLAALLLIVLFHAPLYDRAVETRDEILAMLGGNLNTPIGTRLLMWKAALQMFAAHPWFGIGMNQFDTYLQAMAASGAAPQFIAIYGHAHNEYLEALACGGIVGLAYLLFLFGAPLTFFSRQLVRLRAGGADASPAFAGLVTVLCFAGFALGDNIFDRQMTTSLFALLTLGFAVMTADAPALPDRRIPL